MKKLGRWLIVIWIVEVFIGVMVWASISCVETTLSIIDYVIVSFLFANGYILFLILIVISLIPFGNWLVDFLCDD